ncbi:MAG: hypothetical protein EKK48_10655 [Candidatus Melainabacteria bacterium]|nr:MAG: hypothetical protein EKK48_10655 [Candidatus Melainabacteria bacterium]
MEEDNDEEALKIQTGELLKWLVIRRSSPGEGPELRASPVPKRPSPDSGTNAANLNSPGAEDEI